MSTTFTRMTIAAALCAAALISQPAALSAERTVRADLKDHEQFRFTFRFNAEALDSEQGAKRVYLDLKRQAARACTVGVPSGTEIQRMDKQCAAELTSAVVRRIASRTLAAQLDYGR